MKNRILVLLFAVVSIGSLNTQKVSAQISSIASREYWIDVDSYNGFITNSAFKYQINLNGVDLNYSNWYLAVSVDSPITNGEGKTIDPSKISIRINDIKGLGKTVAPTIPDLGIVNTPKLLINNNAYIVENSNFSLKTGGDHDNNKQYVFYFDIIVEGGEYLEELKSWNKYFLSLTFSALSSDKATVLTKHSVNTDFRIYPKDTPPSGPDFGFEVHADASLNFNVPEDYTRKVESSEESWLKVSSKTSKYVVKVHTSDLYFEGQNDIPVDVVSMQVEDKKDSRTGSEVSLKNSDQTVFTGNATGTEPRKLDVRYFITENEAKGLATYRPGAYTTRLTYTLLPQ